jgi:hypothetical protein
MKTTLEVSDPLLEEAKAVAVRERTTLRALVEEGLRIVLATKRKRSARFRLRKASVKGTGLQEGFERAPWERIRDAAYGGRGA